jgi:glyoxylase-like metal-dependent hydrolase (beta-lactamase superfamily II)
MIPLASGMDYVDLQFRGRAHIIATAVLHSLGGAALIDPGPSTTLVNLKRGLAGKGIGIGDVRQILLTHIHLDHAGGTGSLVRENPRISVYVHERGARHLADPAKLLASAKRLYADQMDDLWGEVAPLPRSCLTTLSGGERVNAGGRELEVAATPGHAAHHVSYFDRSSGVAFTGDTAGIRRARDYILPPTPPPDIDLEAWRSSADKILAWNPDTLFLTHFGPFHGPRVHFQELFARIASWSEIVRRLLADSTLEEQQREQRFIDEVLRDLRRVVGDEEAANYGRAGRLDFSYQGLARYWRERDKQP